MRRDKQHQSRQRWINWVEDRLGADRRKYVFVTLTLKQGIRLDDGRWEPLTPEAADWNTRTFLSALNRKVLGNSYKRHHSRLRVLDVSEGGDHSSTRAHRHMLIELTPRFTVEEFRDLICKLWRGSRWGYDRIDVQPLANARAAIAYMTKTGPDAIRVGTSTF